MVRGPYRVKIQRPTVTHKCRGGDTDWNESAAKPSLFNWECEEVISTEFVDREIVGLGCHSIVAVQNPACYVSSE